VEETPELDRFYRDNRQETNLLLIAVQDTDAAVRNVLADGPYDLPVLMDPQGSIAADYRITGVPTAVVLDADGRLVQTKVGMTTAAELESMAAAAGR
jgi:cytochrome c biogenesis protein CcmG, thiol:disulfide interchange protein DsbE